MKLKAVVEEPFVSPKYDTETLDRTRKALLALAADMVSFEGSFGRTDQVNPVHHLISTAAGWGGLPDAEAIYVGVAPGLPVGEYALTVGDDVPVDGFWSISVYNARRLLRAERGGCLQRQQHHRRTQQRRQRHSRLRW